MKIKSKMDLELKFVGLCYILFTTSPSSLTRGLEGRLSLPFVARGSSPPLQGLGQRPRKFVSLDPILVDEPTYGFVQGFVLGFGHDGFMLVVSCRSGQGNFDYVLIQG